MAIIKHIAVKNANYDAAFDYLTTQHDEFNGRPILDENGRRIPRENFLIDGILCNPFTFGYECDASNHKYGKNQTKNEIKSHHYIISFDPKDKTENGLTMERAHELGMGFAKKNFPGHQTLVCTHPDGHNGNGNIHVHIIINSLRIENVEPPFKERKSDCLAGMKHHVSKGLLNHLKQDVMEMCQRENLYQVDLMNPAKIKITDREYWAQRRGQAELDKAIAADSVSGDKNEKKQQTKYETQKGFLRKAIRTSMENSHSVEELKDRLLSDYGILLFETRGRFSFQMPERTKAIRARQLGTDFEKESIVKYFDIKREKVSFRQPAPSQDISIADRKDQQKYTEKAATTLGRTATKPESVSHPAPAEKRSGQPEQRPAKTTNPTTPPAPAVRLITDLEKCIKAQENPYYAQKVKISNLKEMAKTMSFLKKNGIGSVEELAALVDAASDDTEAKKVAMKATEDRLKTVNLLIKNSGQYFANKKVYGEYLQSGNKKAFREAHTTEIMLYEAARRNLKELSGGKPIPTMKQLKAEKEKLLARKNEQYEAFSFARSRRHELQTVQQNVSMILGSGRQKEHMWNNNREEI